MLRDYYELLRTKPTPLNRSALEQIKKDIFTARSRDQRRIEDLVMEEIRRKHREWLESSSLDTSQLDPVYNVLITDNSIESPFMINSQLIRVIRSQTREFQSKESKARTIYDWIEQNIEYGKIGRYRNYINSKEVLSYSRGICAEMAFLYIAMARSVGLKSNFVSVDIDSFGKHVSHACAAVETERGLVLVDPAYHMYDVKHKRYQIWNDKSIMREFGRLRGR